MNVVFPDSHVDLMGNVTFTRAQLINRWDRELARKWSQPVQDNLRDFMMVKDSLDPETFPEYAANMALLAEFTADKQTCYMRRMTDESRSELLSGAIEHEAAVMRKTELELQVNGRPGVQAEIDALSGEVITPAVPAVEPIPATIDQDGEAVDNPAYIDSLAEIARLQGVIDGASAEVIQLVAERGRI